ncbi:MAG: double-strand break repair helicase AddA, partial [Minwuiales bacterium]|nr:double-strand break repair helicase AddA [Minwuiales bacterium]
QETDPAALPTLLDEQARVLEVEARCKSAAIADRTAALLILGEVLLDAYQAEKKRRALLDYDDLILSTRALLHRPDVAPWVLFKLDGGLDHILVDEAQDTSPEQWEVIAAIANEFFACSGAREDRGGPVRTVFAVGDEKQSVYSFQGADPRRFDAMRRHFEQRVVAAEQAWRPVDLVLSFRSVSAVLGALDAVFATPEARDGVSATDRPIQHLAWRDAAPGLVELWPPIQPEEQPEQAPWDLPLDAPRVDSPRAQLAQRIAVRIATWLKEGEMLTARGRKIRPGDIMILVRRRDAFVEEMVRRLKERNIPVAGTDRMVLTEQIAVMDLIALGNFLLLPDDDLTLATVLKGPLYDFEEDDLFDLAHGRDGFLWQTLRERRDDRPRFAAACAELETLLARADFVPPFEFFGELLGARSGRRRLLARLGPDAADPIDEFLTLCLGYERVRAPSLQGFLHWIEAGRAEIKRDLEQGRDEVRVMTVHGAKGLEASVVFLPDTCSAPAGHYDPRLLPLPDPALSDADVPLLAWPAKRDLDDDHTTAARAAARAEAMREYRRLLYVAMSRAEDRLYICGYDGRNARHPDCWYDLVAEPIKAMAREITLPDGETGWRVETAGTAKAEPAPAPPVPEPGAPLPAWIATPAPAEPRPPKPLTPSRPDGAEPGVLSPLGDDAGHRFRRGLLIHRLLETLPDLPPERRMEAARRWLANPAHALEPAAQTEMAEEVVTVMEDPAIASLFGPESRAEVPLTGLIGDQVVAGQVDRLAIDGDTVRIADYKTHRPPPRDVADVPAVYLAQMAAYRSILSGVYPDKHIECLLIWTDGPRVMKLPEERLIIHA